jgi:hypothetical protein
VILLVFRRVIVGHVDAPVGKSISLMWGLKNFPCIYAPDLCTTRRLLDEWDAQAVLLDTRLDIDANFAFTRSFTFNPTNGDRLVIALSSIYPEDLFVKLRASGFYWIFLWH